MELYEGGAGLALATVPWGGSGGVGGGGSGAAASSLRLTPEEVVNVLRLRVDFVPEEVERAGKALLQLLSQQ